jgi:hypothetical protein
MMNLEIICGRYGPKKVWPMFHALGLPKNRQPVLLEHIVFSGNIAGRRRWQEKSSNPEGTAESLWPVQAAGATINALIPQIRQ